MSSPDERYGAKPPVVEQRPFTVLLASRPPSQPGRAGSSLASLFLHVLLGTGVVYATMALGEEVADESDEFYVELVQETVVPPPPPPPQEVQMPEIAEVKTFQTLSVPTVIPPDIPPPSVGFEFRAEDFTGEGVRVAHTDSTKAAVAPQEIRAEPTFTPYTTPPMLRNREEVAKAILANYPRTLREAGLGGEVMMWFFIDKEGAVLEARVAKSSGFGELDEAAAKVASLVVFSPAKNRDVAVPVWVQIPIYFSVVARD